MSASKAGRRFSMPSAAGLVLWLAVVSHAADSRCGSQSLQESGSREVWIGCTASTDAEDRFGAIEAITWDVSARRLDAGDRTLAAIKAAAVDHDAKLRRAAMGALG